MNDKIIEINDILLKLLEIKKWIYAQENDNLEDSFSQLYRWVLDYLWEEEAKDKGMFLSSDQDKKIFFDAPMNPPSPNTKLQHEAQTYKSDVKTRFNIGDIIEHTQPGFFVGERGFHVIGEVIEIIQGETPFSYNENTYIQELIRIKVIKENMSEEFPFRTILTTEEYTKIIQKAKD